MIEYGIALGSNMGDRWGHLQRALASLGSIGKVLARSSIYETAPVDCPPGSGAFLNAVAILESGEAPGELLARMQTCETLAGRMAKRERHAPRPIDLDLLYAGDIQLHSSALIIPHPRLHERKFVLMPLSEIRPNLVLPGFSTCIRDLLRDLPPEEATLEKLDWREGLTPPSAA